MIASRAAGVAARRLGSSLCVAPQRRGRRLADRAPAPRRSSLIRGEEALARAYDFILDARFDQVDAELRRACGPAPPKRATCSPRPRCGGASCSIPTTARWTTSSAPPSIARSARPRPGPSGRRTTPRRGSISAAPTPRACSGACCATSKLAAARDGKRIKQALERAIELRPGPRGRVFRHRALPVLRRRRAGGREGPAVLPACCPAATRPKGSRRCCARATAGGCCRARRTTSCTSSISGTSASPRGRSSCSQALHEHYPGNPLFPAQIAEIQDTYQHDVTASLDYVARAARSWRASSASTCRRSPKSQARLGVAAAARGAAADRHAIELLQGGRRRDAAGAVLGAGAGVSRGWARRRIGWDRAPPRSTAYRRRGRRRPPPIRTTCASARPSCLRRAPNAGTAEAYRLSLEGWRRLEDDDLPAAPTALASNRSRSTSQDPVAHYRFGRVLEARRDDAGALAHFEIAIRNARTCPAPILGDRVPRSGAAPRASRPPRRRDRRTTAPPRRCSAAPKRRAAAATRALARLAKRQSIAAGRITACASRCDRRQRSRDRSSLRLVTRRQIRCAHF